MPTEIHFAAENVRVEVDEDPAQVAEAFNAAHGQPFRLTAFGKRGDVYVNPAMLAFWSPSRPSFQPDLPEESPQPGAQRQGLTDIWGQPLRRRPRR